MSPESDERAKDDREGPLAAMDDDRAPYEAGRRVAEGPDGVDAERVEALREVLHQIGEIDGYILPG